MSEYEITVKFVPICCSCGAELDAVHTQSKPTSEEVSTVPDAKPYTGEDSGMWYATGWNDCREAMLTITHKEQP